jgi:hypothetical protein
MSGHVVVEPGLAGIGILKSALYEASGTSIHIGVSAKKAVDLHVIPD